MKKIVFSPTSFPRHISFWSLFSKMLSKEQVARMRINYENEKFGETSLVSKEPISQFDLWFREAVNTENIGEANAMTLATCSA